MRRHRLHREIVTTVVVNAFVDTAGITCFHRLSTETGADAPELRPGARRRPDDLRGGRRSRPRIAALDHAVAADTQTRMRLAVRTLVERATRWLVNERPRPLDISGDRRRARPGRPVGARRPARGARPARGRGRGRRAPAELREAGVPDEPRGRASPALPAGVRRARRGHDRAPSRRTSTPTLVARVHFALAQRLGLDRLMSRITALPREDRWSTMARAALRDDLHTAHARLTAQVVALGGPSGEPAPSDPARRRGRAGRRLGTGDARGRAAPGRRCAPCSPARPTWPRPPSPSASSGAWSATDAAPGPASPRPHLVRESGRSGPAYGRRSRPDRPLSGRGEAGVVGLEHADRPPHPLQRLRRHRHPRRAGGGGPRGRPGRGRADRPRHVRRAGPGGRGRVGSTASRSSAGIELSCSRQGQSVHLLAYGADPEAAALAEEMVRVREGRTGPAASRARPAGRARRAGHRGGGAWRRSGRRPRSGGRTSPTRWSRPGWVADRTEAFDRFLADGGPAHVGRYAIEVGHGIDLVHAAGGVAVIAHPWGRGRAELLPPEFLAELVERARPRRHRGRPPGPRRRGPGRAAGAGRPARRARHRLQRLPRHRQDRPRPRGEHDPPGGLRRAAQADPRRRLTLPRRPVGATSGGAIASSRATWLSRQLDGGHGQVLLEVRERGRARDEQDAVVVGEQPGQPDLGRRRVRSRWATRLDDRVVDDLGHAREGRAEREVGHVRDARGRSRAGARPRRCGRGGCTRSAR